jgi:hypothetical protein
MGFASTKTASPVNQMFVAGIFEETGVLNEHTRSVSGNTAYVGGKVSSAGVELFNEEIAQAVYSGGVEMQVEGISMPQIDKLGKFGLVAANQAKAVSSAVPTGTLAGYNPITYTSDPKTSGEVMTNSAYLGSSKSYKLLNYQINTKKPVQLYLKADSTLTGLGLDATTVGKSIATAAETWDRSTSKELFKDNVVVSTNAVADTGDGYSVHAFIPIDGSAIAYARTWTSRGYVVDSDVCYDSDGYTTLSDGSIAKNRWTTTWNNNWWTKDSDGTTKLFFDVQSLALHELGHTGGMGDLYLINSKDWYQVMNSYDGPQRYLGAGDIAGLQKKYGM